MQQQLKQRIRRPPFRRGVQCRLLSPPAAASMQTPKLIASTELSCPHGMGILLLGPGTVPCGMERLQTVSAGPQLLLDYVFRQTAEEPRVIYLPFNLLFENSTFYFFHISQTFWHKISFGTYIIFYMAGGINSGSVQFSL